jgi:hypothetical protein
VIPSKGQFNSNKEGLAALGRAVSSAKEKNEAAKNDPWVNTGKDVANDYRDPMPSVRTLPKGSKGPSGTEIVRGSYRDTNKG